MARTTQRFKCDYTLSVESVIRGHHVYKEMWNPSKGEKLKCMHDTREEAKIFDDYAVGTYKDERLVGHVPIEFSFLFCKFVEKKNNEIFAEVSGSRKLENGLVVPATYRIIGNKKHVETFNEEMKKLKNGKAIYMNINISDIKKGTFF